MILSDSGLIAAVSQPIRGSFRAERKTSRTLPATPSKGKGDTASPLGAIGAGVAANSTGALLSPALESSGGGNTSTPVMGSAGLGLVDSSVALSPIVAPAESQQPQPVSGSVRKVGKTGEGAGRGVFFFFFLVCFFVCC